jgi:Ribbon-helix-helix protein, copG family
MQPTSNSGQRSRRRRIQASLSEEDVARLDDLARRSGIDRAECAGELIRKGLGTPPTPDGTDAEKLDHIFAPVHRQFAEGGMTEEDLYQFLEEVRKEVWQERQRREGGA